MFPDPTDYDDHECDHGHDDEEGECPDCAEMAEQYAETHAMDRAEAIRLAAGCEW